MTSDDRIADLERQVAALTKELAEMEQLYGSEFNLNNNLIAVRAALTKENERLKTIDLDLQMAVQKLAASQAREQKLRQALASEHADHVSLASSELGIDPWECEALAIPTDDTALKAWGAKLLRGQSAVLGAGMRLLLDKADELEGK